MPKRIKVTFHPSTTEDIKWKQIYYVSLEFKRIFRNHCLRIAEDVKTSKSTRISTLVLEILMSTHQYDNFYERYVKPYVANDDSKDDFDEEFEEPRDHISTYLKHIFDEINVRGASIDISFE